MTDRRERPWRKLRIVVEVSVPPTNPAKERDLMRLVRAGVPVTLPFSRGVGDEPFMAAVRLKTFSQFWPSFLRAEKGLNPFNYKKVKDNG